MPSIRQLKDKIKTLNDFKKVVNIQKIASMKEISEIKKVVSQINFRGALFTQYMHDIHKKFGIYEEAMFDKAKSKVPTKRNIHFVMGNPRSDRLGDYSGKLIMEFIEKNHDREDFYVVISKELAEFMISKDLKVIKIMPLVAYNDTTIYQRIAWQIFRGYNDMMFIGATFIYLSMADKQVVETTIFPFDIDQMLEKVKEHSRDFSFLGLADKIYQSVNIKKVNWKRDLNVVSEKIIKLALEMKVYAIIVEYRLSLKMRELQSLDDKEKNILEEQEKIKLLMQRVRKESITNELLTSAVAFGAINKPDEEEEEYGN